MIPLTLTEIAQELNGQLIGADLDITKVSTDTRSLEGGELFVALVGPRFDGHEFIEYAEQEKVAALLVSKQVHTHLAQIVVADTQQALGRLGALVKAKVAPMTAAITGSNGKTTVKEMVAQIIANIAPTLVTQGNFNNEIGVPLTLLRLEPQHQYAVVELGANHKGEIAYTSDLVKPQVALVNNAFEAHIEGFGDLLGVAQAKSEIFGSLNESGIAIINLDSPYSRLWMDKAVNKQIMTYSRQGTGSDVHACGIELNAQGCALFTLVVDGQRLPLALKVPGWHNIDNALAAAAVASAMGLSCEQIVAGLSGYQGVKQRLDCLTLTEQITVIDDSYNANLASVKVAIDVLKLYEGKTVLVLGDMAELGSSARAHHQELGQYAVEQGIDQLLCVGELARHTAKAAGERACYFMHRTQVLEWISKEVAAHPREKINILVKGSNSSGMKQVVEMLKNKFEGVKC